MHYTAATAVSPTKLDIRLGGRIRAIRHAVGLTRADLATHLNLPVVDIDRYEAGSRRIEAHILHRIAEALDVPVGVLVDGAKVMSS